jgi:hypothetical protein
MFNWIRTQLERKTDDLTQAQPRTRLDAEVLETREVPTVLGAAGAFDVFGIGNTSVIISGPSGVTGTMAVGPNGSANLSGSGFVTGALTLDPSSTYIYSGTAAVGSVVSADLTQAASDALTASTTLAGLAPTQTFGVVNNSQVITGNGGQNVINVDGINLGGSAKLALSGGANDFFFINDRGAFAMSGTSSIVLTGGVQASHVIFNVTGTGQTVNLSGGTVGQGTILAVNRDISVGYQLSGSLIGALNHKIEIHSGAKVNGIEFQDAVPPTEGSLSGHVYFDQNQNHVVDGLDHGIGGVTIHLTWTDASGFHDVTTVTADDGSFSFTGLAAGTYTLSEEQPAGYADGADYLGSLGGVLGNDTFQVALGAGQNGINYDYTELFTE